MRAKLEGSSVTLVAGERAAAGASAEGWALAANLLARLYPRIRVQAPAELIRAAEAEIVLVNPAAEVQTSDEPTTATLGYETEIDANAGVSVFARGWNVYVDAVIDEGDTPAPPAALVAAVVGVGEVFRVVFADELDDRGRHGPQPGAFNIVTRGDPVFGLPISEAFDVGSFRLVGAGAIGQAAAKTLAVSGAHGTMTAIDHEQVALSNLQRYVLTRDVDVGAVKVELLRERLSQSAVDVVPVAAEWHAGLVDEQLPTLARSTRPTRASASRPACRARSTTRGRSQRTSAGRGMNASASSHVWPVSTGPGARRRADTNRSQPHSTSIR